MARTAHRKMMHALAGIAGLGKTPAAAIPARLQKAYAKSDDAAKAAIQDLLKPFMPAPGVDPRDYAKAREIVGQFAMGKSGEFKEIKSTGTELLVKGKAVATRASRDAKTMQVCPGKFGADKMSRSAANAVLDVLHAGLSVTDREEMAFLTPTAKKGMGRVVSEKACYTVSIPGTLVRNIIRADEKARSTPEAIKAAYEEQLRIARSQTDAMQASIAKAERRAKRKAAAKKAKRKASSKKRR